MCISRAYPNVLRWQLGVLIQQKSDVFANGQRVKERAILEDHAHFEGGCCVWVIIQQAPPWFAEHPHVALQGNTSVKVQVRPDAYWPHLAKNSVLQSAGLGRLLLKTMPEAASGRCCLQHSPGIRLHWQSSCLLRMMRH